MAHPDYSRFQDRERDTSIGALIGWERISRYLDVCWVTARRWSIHEDLPVCRLPDGRIMTTKSLIDQWVLARSESQEASGQGIGKRQLPTKGSIGASENNDLGE